MGLENKAGAWRLMGCELDNGWKVVEALGWDAETGIPTDIYPGTGGNFSVSYAVERDGKRAFLKAIDFTRAMNSGNTVKALRQLTDAYSFEAQILDICAGARMDRVVIAIDSGEVSVGPNIQDTAPYLIFELADGDVRKKLRAVQTQLKQSFWLRAMHHATVGLTQLHGHHISHQDVKPSNLLSFEGDDGFKIADMGRCINEKSRGPYDHMTFSGDPNYAPPEILYGHILSDGHHRRLSNDLYLLGSMIFFFVKGQGATALLFEKMEPELRPTSLWGPWSGLYKDVLPTIQNKFTEMLSELREDMEDETGDELTKAASELCNPNPKLRGHPLERTTDGTQYSLHRYVSLFDRLARVAAVKAKSTGKT